MADRVECYSGTDYAERPTAVWWEGARLDVAQVDAQWRTPEGKVFRVRTRDGQRFELVYAAPAGAWSIQLLERG